MNHLKFLNPLWMKQRAITAYDSCNTDTPAFIRSGDCVEEGSRIIGLMAVKKGFDIETLIDDTAIDAAVTSGDVRIITEVTGNWPKATANKKAGMGNKRERFSSWTYSIPFKLEEVDANLPFWNDMVLSGDWSLAFVFEDFKAFCALAQDKSVIAMDIEANVDSPEDLGLSRMISGTASWTQRDLPYHLNTLPTTVARQYFDH